MSKTRPSKKQLEAAQRIGDSLNDAWYDLRGLAESVQPGSSAEVVRDLTVARFMVADARDLACAVAHPERG